MTKTSKKILLVLLIALLTVFAFSAKAFAASNDAVDTFKDKNNFKDQTIFVGQKVPVQPDDYSVRYSLSPRVTSSNTKVVDFQDSSNYYLVAKAEGTSTITLECYNGNELLKQSYNIKVVKVKESKLQSKTNDVVSIESNYVEKKDKVLYANGELWDLDITTNKFTKNTGNVKKYTYGDVYFKEGKNTKYPSIFNTLKNNGKLTTKTDVGNLKADKVEDVNTYGYLTTKGKYYAFVLKNDKVIYKQKAKNVEALLQGALIKKADGLYTIDNVKIAKGKIKDAVGNPTSGIYLDSKNVLYSYELKDAKTKKYTLTKVEKNVKEILNWSVYKTKDGKVKTTNKNYTNYEYKNYHYTRGGYLKLKYNGNLYLDDTLIMKDVDELAYSVTNYSHSYIIRKDGSIWDISVGDNSSIKQIRSGKDSAKGLSSPTNVKAKKKSNKKAKVTWKKVDGATKYTVYRATSKNGKYKQVGTAKGGSYTDKTVKKGKKYFYKVVANGSKKLFNSKKSDYVKVKI